MTDFLAPGEIIAGRYRAERVIARGGMGVVVLGTHLQLGEAVALKLLLPELAANADAAARFLREAQAAAKLRSEHVVRVFDVGKTERGLVYMVMEYLEGTDLEHVIRARGRLPVGEALDYVLQACEGVAEAHRRGMVHRDLKPANLFLVRRSDGAHTVKLLDFGISKQTLLIEGSGAEASMTKTSAFFGSPLYVSPEQLRSTRTVDARSDIWSLGVVLYEALAGRTPFFGETFPDLCARILTEPPPAMPPDVPPQIGAIILRCLTKDPRARYASVADLAFALRPFAPLEAQVVADRVVRILHNPVATGSGGTTQDAVLPALKGGPPHATAATFSSTTRGSSPARLVAVGSVGLVGTLAAGYLVFALVTGPKADAPVDLRDQPAAPAAASIASGAAVTPPNPSETAPATPPTGSGTAPATSTSAAPPLASASSRPPTRRPTKPDPGAFGGRD